MKTREWEEVIALLENLKDRQAMLAVLSVLLTNEESHAIGLRLAIMRALIAEQESQREIATRLQTSIAKVTRCSNYLKTLGENEKQLIEGQKTL